MASQEPILLHSGHAQNEEPVVTDHLWTVCCKSASFRNSVREIEGTSQSSRAAFNCLNCHNTLLSPLQSPAPFTIHLPAWQQMRQCLNILQSLPTGIMNNLHQPRTPDSGEKQSQTISPMPLTSLTRLSPICTPCPPFHYSHSDFPDICMSPVLLITSSHPLTLLPNFLHTLPFCWYSFGSCNLFSLFLQTPFPDPSPFDHDCRFPFLLATGDQLVSSAGPLPSAQWAGLQPGLSRGA